MVQGYPQEDSSCSSFGCSLAGIGNAGTSFPLPEGTAEVSPRLSSSTGLRIQVDIRMSNGVHISQKNLSYAGLKSLVEKLEVLC